MDVGDAILIGLIVGIVLGLIPLAVGLWKGRTQLAWIGFVATAISGALLGLLLAVPVAIIFTIAIFMTARDRRTTTTAV